jgi:hypothetical protein
MAGIRPRKCDEIAKPDLTFGTASSSPSRAAARSLLPSSVEKH